jgi:preprotein translocase subunit SecE
MATITTQQKQKKVSFLRDVQHELKKVTWTSRTELIISTKAVIIATFVFGLGIYLCDLIIRGAINGVGVFMRQIFG